MRHTPGERGSSLQVEVWHSLRQGTLKEEQVSDMEKDPSPDKSQAPGSVEIYLMKKSNFFL